MLFRCI